MPTPLDYFSAIAPPVGNFISTIVANQQNKSLMRENRDWQEKMMRYQNEYNSPSAQRARAIRAGIAPNFAPQGAAEVQSVYQPNIQSANFDGFGSVASKFREAALQDESIKQQRDATYRSGVESAVFLQEKMLDIAKSMSELSKLRKDNREADIRYDQLSSQYDQFMEMFDDTVEINRQTAAKLGVDIENAKAARVRADNEFKELVRNHKTIEAISWYNAKTQRQLANSEEYRNYSRASLNEAEMFQANALTEKIQKETHLINMTNPYNIKIKELQAMCEGFNAEERKAAAAVALVNSEFMRRKSYSPILYILQAGFGLDSDDVLSVGGFLGLGASILNRYKSYRDKLPSVPKAGQDGYHPGLDNQSYEDFVRSFREGAAYSPWNPNYPK